MADIATNPQVNNQKTGTGTTGGKNFIVVAIVILVILIVLAVAWFSIKSLSPSTTTTTTPTASQGQAVPEIKSDADLGKLENELNTTDLDGLTKELDQNDKDAAEF